MMTESRQGDERAQAADGAARRAGARRTRRLRVAMDVQSLQTARTGVRTYVDELLREFARPDAPHRVVPLAGPKRLPSRVRLFRIINQAMYFPWLHLWLPLRLWLGRYDVLFSPEYLTARWTPVPRVVTFHDAMFLRRPQDYNRLWLRVFRWVSLPALRRSAAVIVPSGHAAEETATYASVSRERIQVVPLGGPTGSEPLRVAEADAAPVLARYGLAPGAYVLHVGVLERRKNLVTLVRAFDQYRRRAAESVGDGGAPAEWKLVLAGQPGPRPDLDDSQNIRRAIAELGLENDVILTGHVATEERNALYTRAGAVAVPSLHEGFGIPVLEAFAAGVPVLSARSTSLPEVAGEAALYFDPGSVDELAGAIARVAGDAELRGRLVAAGAERVREFTWARTAAETMAVFEQVVALAHAAMNSRRTGEGGVNAP